VKLIAYLHLLLRLRICGNFGDDCLLDCDPVYSSRISPIWTPVIIAEVKKLVASDVSWQLRCPSISCGDMGTGSLCCHQVVTCELVSSVFIQSTAVAASSVPVCCKYMVPCVCYNWSRYEALCTIQ
jgi:hypothetical protein